MLYAQVVEIVTRVAANDLMLMSLLVLGMGRDGETDWDNWGITRERC